MPTIASLKLFGFMLLATLASVSFSQAEVVRFNTNLGSFDVDLYEDVAPQTVANFLFYLDSGLYTESIAHRSVPGFVIQGGGYDTSGIPISTAPSVVNEPGMSNLRGTIAMAKLAGDPDSATSQWFFNLDDNLFLDADNGGFTVFGHVMGSGMDVIDQIASLDIVDANGGNPNGPFGSLPLIDISQPISDTNLVVFNSIVSVPEPSGLSLLLITSAWLGCRRTRKRKIHVESI